MANQKSFWAKTPPDPTYFLNQLAGIRKGVDECHGAHEHHAGDPGLDFSNADCELSVSVLRMACRKQVSLPLDSLCNSP